MEDFRCAVDLLVTLDYVDEDRIGVVGVCGGGGYAATAARTDRRIKALGTVVAANYGRIVDAHAIPQPEVHDLPQGDPGVRIAGAAH
ncbi:MULTISPECIES: acetylxylan esterase [unclassified Streptomyces]|uniref:dienelactone hydrolase family protein n=1 Tax=Streptomyces TaxID=1883 RepID=UPI0033A79275